MNSKERENLSKSMFFVCPNALKCDKETCPHREPHKKDLFCKHSCQRFDDSICQPILLPLGANIIQDN